MKPILFFSEIRKKDVPKVGGKNASLGEMYSKLKSKGIRVPNGFALTSKSYDLFIKENKLDKEIKKIFRDLDTRNIKNLRKKGKEVRQLILKSKIPEKLEKEILKAYKKLQRKYGKNIEVAVRSSATAEDLPKASFAGQQETFLNVKGKKELLESIVKCYASLFTDRAISYREEHGFDQFSVKLSIGVQKMVGSDASCSGVMFTIDPNSGFDKVVLIEGSYGLGEFIVQGVVNPDSYFVFKPTGKIIKKKLGSKKAKLIFDKKGGTKRVNVPEKDRKKFILNNKEVEELARYAMIIEKHYKKPMDIEWAKDKGDGMLYIVQARPETVHSKRKVIEKFKLVEKSDKIVEGVAVGRKISTGKVHIIKNVKNIEEFKKGEILVTKQTDPDWEPIMKIASGIITEQGGSTSHAAIVSRELGVPAVVGAKNATSKLKNKQEITIDCSSSKGIIWKGRLKYKIDKLDIKKIPKTKTKVMLILGTPEQAFDLTHLQPDGIGLARIEHIIGSIIKMHPLYAIEKGKQKFYVEKLAEGIGMLAASVYPGQVIVRFSDFKTNEYRNLLGGRKYEPEENNPMLGWRGAARYISKEFKPAFLLECEAIRKVRDEMGLKNVDVMIPFCRTIDEGREILKILKEIDLRKKLKVYVMAEIPSNILLVEEFAKIFDGFSIGSNDLTQLTLGMDRDNPILNFDERNEAVKKLIRDLIKVAHKYKKPVGICGQAPSKYPEYVKFLIKNKIDSISVNLDVFFETKIRVNKIEKKK
jgi:pyruvate,water dikinase